MIRALGLTVAAVMLLAGCDVKAAGPAKENAYDFQFESIEGGPLALADYRGKTLLVVNTASHCGFTPQYEALEKVWQKYRERGLVVVGVPSNDFGQEGGSSEEIRQFCESYFGIDFPLTAQTVIKGKDAHPFYRWAQTELGPDAVPRWNFYKYLVGKDGHLVAMFASDEAPQDAKVIKAIEANLPK
jgi:glutathione peroxidase